MLVCHEKKNMCRSVFWIFSCQCSWVPIIRHVWNMWNAELLKIPDYRVIFSVIAKCTLVGLWVRFQHWYQCNSKERSWPPRTIVICCLRERESVFTRALIAIELWHLLKATLILPTIVTDVKVIRETSGIPDHWMLN